MKTATAGFRGVVEIGMLVFDEGDGQIFWVAPGLFLDLAAGADARVVDGAGFPGRRLKWAGKAGV